MTKWVLGSDGINYGGHVIIDCGHTIANIVYAACVFSVIITWN